MNESARDHCPPQPGAAVDHDADAAAGVSPIVKAGTGQRTFARALRELRGGHSQQQLADRVSCSREYVSLVERCLRWPTRQFAEQCDRVLRTGGALVRLWPDAERERLAHRRSRCCRRKGRGETSEPSGSHPD